MPDPTFRVALLASIPVLFVALALAVSSPADHTVTVSSGNHALQASMDCDPLDPVCYVHRG